MFSLVRYFVYVKFYLERECVVEINIKVKFIISEINDKWFFCNFLKN